MTRLSDTFFPEPHLVDLLTLDQVRAHDDSTAYIEIYPEVCASKMFWSERSMYIHEHVWRQMIDPQIVNIDIYDITSFEQHSLQHLVTQLQKQRNIHDIHEHRQLSVVLTKLIAWLLMRDRGVMFLGL